MGENRAWGSLGGSQTGALWRVVPFFHGALPPLPQLQGTSLSLTVRSFLKRLPRHLGGSGTGRKNEATLPAASLWVHAYLPTCGLGPFWADFRAAHSPPPRRGAAQLRPPPSPLPEQTPGSWIPSWEGKAGPGLWASSEQSPEQSFTARCKRVPG